MPRATSFCARSPCCSARDCARATRWRAWAATSSACCSSTARRSPRCASPRRCARPWPISASSGRIARSTSASASAWSTSSDASQTLAAVLSAADAACYMAKDKGRNRVQVYSPDSNEVTVRHGEMEWVNRAAPRARRASLLPVRAAGLHRTRGDNADAALRGTAAAAARREQRADSARRSSCRPPSGTT